MIHPVIQPSVILIEWVDAVALDEPRPENPSLAVPETVYAVGWLIHEDDTQMRIAQHWNEHGVGGVWSVPKISIKSTTYLNSAPAVFKAGKWDDMDAWDIGAFE